MYSYKGGISMKRKYVVVCNRHNSIYNGLLFWGNRTSDENNRSFGGYTSDINNCEFYTLEEIENSGNKFPIYGKDCNRDNYKKFDDVAIEIRRLKGLGYRQITIYVR